MHINAAVWVSQQLYSFNCAAGHSSTAATVGQVSIHLGE